MIWDEGLRTTLHSVQRYIVSGSFPAKRALRPLMLLSAMRPTEGGITSADAFRRITSPDVSPGITSRRSRPCVPACSSPALRPGPFLPSLASNVLFQHHFLRSRLAPEDPLYA